MFISFYEKIDLVYNMQVFLLKELDDEKRTSLYNVSRALRYFVANRSYGYIDRLANAFSLATLRHVLSEIMRDLRSAFDRGESVYLPSDKDIENLLLLAEKDLSIVKIVVAYALAFPERR